MVRPVVLLGLVRVEIIGDRRRGELVTVTQIEHHPDHRRVVRIDFELLRAETVPERQAAAGVTASARLDRPSAVHAHPDHGRLVSGCSSHDLAEEGALGVLGLAIQMQDIGLRGRRAVYLGSSGPEILQHQFLVDLVACKTVQAEHHQVLVLSLGQQR